jgi:hypothetical protein
MESLNINHNIYNLIIKSNLYKNFILRIYIINNLEYIDKNNLNELIQLFNLYKYKINLNNIHKIHETVLFNKQSYNLINKYILLNMIKTHNNELLFNTIVFLIENIPKMKLYPDYTYKIKKFENEIKKLKIEIQNLQKIKTEINDLKNIINYINNKMNKTYESKNIYSNNTSVNNTSINNTSVNNTYKLYFPNIQNT